MARAGHLVRQPQGYVAFVPYPLPPRPPLKLDPELQVLLSHADQALGRLDGAAEILPNPDLFVAMFVRQEAVMSSQIEGTQASLLDVLQYEAQGGEQVLADDVGEVVNYVAAMNYGLRNLQRLPLSLRLIREIHAELLRQGRGAERQPGEFRTSQNWIGGANVPLERAVFVPPPPGEMMRALADLETFLHDPAPLPVLIKAGLAHAQFESIHPFLDGNGRMGRLLVTFLLVQQGVLRRPLLYLSGHLKRAREEYYSTLQAVRTDGDWEGWIRFFLQGVAQAASSATATACSILQLREAHRQKLAGSRGSATALRLLDLLYEQPVVTIDRARTRLGVTFPTASRAVDKLVANGILRQMGAARRNRTYAYDEYLALFESLPATDSAQQGGVRNP